MSLQTIIPGTTPTAQDLDSIVLEGVVLDDGVLDVPDPDEFVENAPEVFCLACQAPVAAFDLSLVISLVPEIWISPSSR